MLQRRQFRRLFGQLLLLIGDGLLQAGDRRVLGRALPLDVRQDRRKMIPIVQDYQKLFRQWRHV